MNSKFSKEDAEKIAGAIGADRVVFHADHFRMKVVNESENRSLVLEIYPEVTLGKSRGMLIVVYTNGSHQQLHNCSGYVISEELGEVTFVSRGEKRLSGLVVEQGASCSQYASINRDLISSDFTQLGVEVVLSGVAMSLVEDIIDEDEDEDE